MIKIFQFLLGISIAISSPAISQTLSQTSSSQSTLIFQSQFSRNLAQNFQDAKSEGCFVLYDLKRDRYIRYNSNRCKKDLFLLRLLKFLIHWLH